MRERLKNEDPVAAKVYFRLHDTDPWEYVNGNSGYASTDRCIDEHPTGDLIIEHKRIISPISDLIVPTGFGGEFRYTDWVLNSVDNPLISPTGPWLYPGKPTFWGGTVNQRATRLAAMTNISSPVVSVDQFIGELKDMPSSILKRGRQGISWAQTESLGVRFGIMPMVSDMLKLANIAEYTHRKDEQLKRLLGKTGLYRRVKMGVTTNSTTHDLSSGYGAGAYVQRDTKVERWGTIRWKPGGALKPPNPQDLDQVKLVRGLLTGTSKYNDRVSYLSTAWELLPWSWLADWCGDLGTYLAATRNQNISVPEEIWIMEKSITTQQFVTSAGTTEVYHESKLRNRGFITATAGTPYISGDRAAILSGLFVRSPSPIPKRYQ